MVNDKSAHDVEQRIVTLVAEMHPMVTQHDTLNDAICKLLEKIYTGQWCRYAAESAPAVQEFTTCDTKESGKLSPVLLTAALNSLSDEVTDIQSSHARVDVVTGYLGSQRAVTISIVVSLAKTQVYTHSQTYICRSPGEWNFVDGGRYADYRGLLPDSGDRSRNEPVYLMSAKATRSLTNGRPLTAALDDIRHVAKQQGWSDVQAFGQQLLFIS